MILFFTRLAGKVQVRFLLATIIFLMTSALTVAQNKPKKETIDFNENCLKCHGQSKYKYVNPESGSEVTKRMYLETIVNRTEFYDSNHKTFKCTDCHSEDYDTFHMPASIAMAVMRHMQNLNLKKLKPNFRPAFMLQNTARTLTAGCVTTHTPIRLMSVLKKK